MLSVLGLTGQQAQRVDPRLGTGLATIANFRGGRIMGHKRWFVLATLAWGCGAPTPNGTPDSDSHTESSAHSIDAGTMIGKHMLGYQGWFGCPGDDSDFDDWMHWSPSVEPSPETVTFDAWPDTRELGDDERCETSMKLADGSAASLFSAHNPTTVDRHFEWMEDAGIDGVFLQRFSSVLSNDTLRAFRDQVAVNVESGAESHGRIFALMYDISGHDSATLVEDLEADWTYLVNELRLTSSASYLTHNGKPVVGIWGLGFDDRPATPDQGVALLDFFQNNPDVNLQATVVGGVPTYWRTLTGDSSTDPSWTSVYLSFDVISPWAVGRFADASGADNFRTTQIEPDLALTNSLGIDYMPVAFPGFSWANLKEDESLFNKIPRDGGNFYWRQLYNARQAGASMLYTAMFDEVDEATAMFKVAPNSATRPTEGTFLTLDADGTALPADWYLDLAGAASEVIRGERSATATIPIEPNWDDEPEETTETSTPSDSGTESAGDWNSFVVTGAYRGILGREPDAAGLSNYTNRLTSGLTVLQLTTVLFNSTEFATNRASLSAEDFATELYWGILERAPDDGGLADTIYEIEQGRGPIRAAAMLESEEAQQLFAN